MLGTKTKQIYSYGKRNQRIVTVSDDRNKIASSIFDDIEPAPRAPIVARMKKRIHTVNTPSSPKIAHLHRKKNSGPLIKVACLSEEVEVIKPLPPSKTGSILSTMSSTPTRLPLAPFSLNTPASLATTPKPRVTGVKRRPSTLKPAPTFVDVDILILDDDGKIVGQERRVSQTGMQPSHNNQAKRDLVKDPSQLEPVPLDDGDSIELKRPRRLAKRAIITVDSDSDLETDSIRLNVDGEHCPSSAPTHPQSNPTPMNSSSLSNATSMAGPSRLKVEVIIPPAPYAIKRISSNKPTATIEPLQAPTRYQQPPAPFARERQLTPIRRGRWRKPFSASPPYTSPSLTSTDLDLSFDIEELNSTELGTPALPECEISDYLKPLLAECGQSACGPIEFSSFIETFPYDPVVRSLSGQHADLQFRKIGEASYSEVFGIGDVVLKVIPLREECDKSIEDINEDDGPAPSDAKDVLKEIIVTDAMGQVSDGFVRLLKAYVVRGKYPEVLLRLWDEYHMNKGSESVRPDTFLVSQVYTIIVLPNGGQDLEAYQFVNGNKVGWRQACSIFWQVAKTLAHAEQLVSFEHRDLHLGQILVKNLHMSDALPLQARSQNSQSNSEQARLYMDDLAHGVRATLIDLGLSRMDAGDGSGGERVHWTPFEEEVFMGEGDYQFDVYRMMKLHNGGAWEEFKPLTNVMWLHFLAKKLIKSKRLKAPSSRTSPTTNAPFFTERNCYECLVDIEGWLRTCMAALASPKANGKGKRKAPTVPVAPPSGPSCAGEIVAYAIKKGWIREGM